MTELNNFLVGKNINSNSKPNFNSDQRPKFYQNISTLNIPGYLNNTGNVPPININAPIFQNAQKIARNSLDGSFPTIGLENPHFIKGQQTRFNSESNVSPEVKINFKMARSQELWEQEHSEGFLLFNNKSIHSTYKNGFSLLNLAQINYILQEGYIDSEQSNIRKLLHKNITSALDLESKNKYYVNRKNITDSIYRAYISAAEQFKKTYTFFGGFRTYGGHNFQSNTTTVATISVSGETQIKNTFNETLQDGDSLYILGKEIEDPYGGIFYDQKGNNIGKSITRNGRFFQLFSVSTDGHRSPLSNTNTDIFNKFNSVNMDFTQIYNLEPNVDDIEYIQKNTIIDERYEQKEYTREQRENGEYQIELDFEKNKIDGKTIPQIIIDTIETAVVINIGTVLKKKKISSVSNYTIKKAHRDQEEIKRLPFVTIIMK